MRFRVARTPAARRAGAEQRASVLIIVLWVAFGLASLALYFGHAMSLELRAADNRFASTEAEQAINGAARYVSNVLANAETPGTLPDLQTYRCDAVPVAEALFWVIGRDTNDLQRSASDRPAFGLIDEASKLNLNTATREMLEALPRMTPELAAAIIDWRDADDNVTEGGAESQTYLLRTPAYRCKNAPFETIDELRLVLGAYVDIVYGEDANLNGILDSNENDGDLSPPIDNRDGRLDSGILDYVTVYSREANTRTNVNNPQQLAALLQEKFKSDRANQILSQITGAPAPGGGGRGGRGNTPAPGTGGNAAANIRSVLEFYLRSGMTRDEFTQIESDITVTNSQYLEGLINVNTASEAVLACIPGIGTDKAPSLVAYRQSNTDKVSSVAWVAEVLDRNSAIQAGPYLTARSYQFTADIAAVGHYGRGYRRVKFIFDTSGGAPRIIYRQDLTHLGWALGRSVRQAVLLAKEIR